MRDVQGMESRLFRLRGEGGRVRVVRVVGRMRVEAMMTAGVEGMVRMRWVVREGSTCWWVVLEKLTVGLVGGVL